MHRKIGILKQILKKRKEKKRKERKGKRKNEKKRKEKRKKKTNFFTLRTLTESHQSKVNLRLTKRNETKRNETLSQKISSNTQLLIHTTNYIGNVLHALRIHHLENNSWKNENTQKKGDNQLKMEVNFSSKNTLTKRKTICFGPIRNSIYLAHSHNDVVKWRTS